jgi:membrane-bound serine protease (ClpP class)
MVANYALGGPAGLLWERRALKATPFRAVWHTILRALFAAVLVLCGALAAHAQESVGAHGASNSASIVEKLAHGIVRPWITIGLLVFGCSLLYHEMLTPKTWGVSGNLGAISVGTVFAANIAVGEVGWVGVLLLLAGLVFILLEVHLFPGFGSAIAGFVLMYAGMFQSLGGTKNAPFALGVTTVLIIVAGLAFLAYLPKSPAWKQVGQKIQAQQALNREPLPSNVLSPDELRYFGPTFLVGQKGVVVVALRPVGVGEFGGIRRRVITEGEFLAEGASIVISRIEGERVVVDPLEQAAPQPTEVTA